MEVKNVVTTQVPAGSKVILDCYSNDYAHNFLFWLINGTYIIGPDNPHDERKYKYEVLSGRLHIHDVSPEESGYYHCVSKKLSGSGFSAGQVDMIVTGSTFSAIDVVKLVAITVSLIVLICCAVLYFRLRREWRNYEGRTVVPVDDVEDDGDGDEIYNRTTTAISEPVPGPSRNQSSDHLIYGIDNQGLDTDFNSVFENIQIKSPAASLI